MRQPRQRRKVDIAERADAGALYVRVQSDGSGYRAVSIAGRIVVQTIRGPGRCDDVDEVPNPYVQRGARDAA